jgi:hypothetical protein
MSFSKFFSNVKRYDQNAAVIFNREEPVGRATDLVMPRRRWFGRHRRQEFSPARPAGLLPNDR